MTVSNMNDPGVMAGASVEGSDGAKLGKIHSIYLDNTTRQPEWAAVKTGMFGGHVCLVPLRQGEWDGSTLSVPFDKEQLRNAPHHDPDTEISVQDEQELYRHYGIDYGASGGTDDSAGGGRTTGGPGHDTSGPETDEAMTRSEERLHVGTESHEVGKARLRKYIVTENVETSVPVRHEEVTVEREPITDANRGDAMAGGDLTGEEHEVTLHEERVVTHTETVPVERVRLGKETVTEEEQVNETVRKERIDSEGAGIDAGGRQQARKDR
jgi:uncharacterized protein (TIGR02271 family)